MKNLVYALGILGATLAAGNSYSQTTEEIVKTEEIKKEFRKLDTAAKNLPSTLIYTNPLSINFKSLDEKTQQEVYIILAAHYEMEMGQCENKLKEYGETKAKNVEFQKTIEKLTSDNKALMSERDALKEKYDPVVEKRK